MSAIKIVSTGRLKELNDAAIDKELSYGLNNKCIDLLDPKGWHILVPVLLCEDEVICNVVMKFKDESKCQYARMGFLPEEFMRLPDAKMIEKAYKRVNKFFEKKT